MITTHPLAQKVADVLKKSDLTFAEQVATLAAIEMIHYHMNSALQNDLEQKYGREATRLLKFNIFA